MWCIFERDDEVRTTDTALSSGWRSREQAALEARLHWGADWWDEVEIVWLPEVIEGGKPW